ncbi:MAG TPA: ATP-binding protein [Saprospiraceae bacterium]|nr:ATP-binding protein [Saprospiraceae bacterium]
MRRLITNKLEEWKNSKYRKPLIIQGARQVGKTWIMKSFGNTHFQQVAYINFESSVRLQTIFKDDFDIQRILLIFEIETGITIQPETTLIILDEIQEAEKGLTALKYFNENAPEYFVIAAGSLLGVSLQKNNTFPVGKVELLGLFPLSFEEFLINQEESGLVNALLEKKWNVVEPFHEKLTKYLRMYYFVGGMPEAVQSYIESKNFQKVRTIQTNIISGYQNDFAKYAPIEIVPKIRMVWQSVIGQLAKENRKFVYGQLKKGARAKEFESAINWLVNAGLLVKCMKVVKPTIPLKSYADYDVFKLYLLDVGLLNAMANVSEQILLNKNQILVEFKGALTEQFVCQELIINHEVFYWTAENASAEVDFILQKAQEVIPIEVKAEENLKAKSIKVFVENFKPNQAIRTSMSFYRKENWMENVPLYAMFVL